MRSDLSLGLKNKAITDKQKQKDSGNECPWNANLEHHQFNYRQQLL